MFSLKPMYDDFLPVWKWEIPVGKKRRAKNNYNTVVSTCRISQYILAAFCMLLTISFEHSRQLLFSTFRNCIPFFLGDIFTYLILGYVLGVKRFPVNYISLVIIKTFVILEDKFRPDLYKLEAKVLGPSQSNGYWSVVTASPKAVPPLLPAYVRNTAVVLAVLAVTWTGSKLYNIDLNKYRHSILISQTVATSLAALLLVSTFSFDTIPDFKETHRKFCEVWILFGGTILVGAMTFLFVRLQYALLGKLKPADLVSRVEWESFIFILAFSIVVRLKLITLMTANESIALNFSYFPVIHKGFSSSDICAQKSLRLLEAVLPTTIINLGKAFTTWIYGSS